MSDCDVVFLSHGDWANVGSHLAESLRRVGVNAKSWANWHLKIDMPIKSSIYVKWEEAYSDIRGAKVVWLMHGNIFKYRHTPIRKSQLICAFHGGPPLLLMQKGGGVNQGFFGRYRRRDLHPVHFIQMPKLFDDCYFLEKRHLLSLPVDTKRLQPVYYKGKKKLSLGHFPRNTGTSLKTKGYAKVVRVFTSLRKQYPEQFTGTKFINWNLHIDRVAKCDIYVEKISEICKEWGVSALEAAALGKIVISQFSNRDTYEKYYGKSPVIGVETEKELREVLLHIASWSVDNIYRKQEETRAWIEKYHSFEAVGKRLKDILIKEGAAI
jgi:hypothetical protein